MKKYFKISGIILLSTIILLGGCNKEGDKFDYGKEVIVVSGTESNPLVKFTVEDVPSTYVVSASSTGKAREDIEVTFAIDTTLVESYNQINGTSYYPIPQSSISLENTKATIQSGSATSTGVSVKVVSVDKFIDGRTYIIPVTITQVQGGGLEVLPASKTIYLRVSRVISFKSLDMTDPNFYGNYYAAAPVDLPKFSYEIKCYINEWHAGSEPISRLCNFGPLDESVTNLLRFGENGQDINALQWVSPGGGLISNTRFNTGQWYTITLTFDGQNYIMYVNGVKDSELAGTKGTTFQRLELGMSWYDSGSPSSSYPFKQRFLGRIAEIRLWKRALTSSEIQVGLCGVDPKSTDLLAYWKLMDGNGYTFKDYTGNGYDMDWSQAYQNDQQLDKSSYVKWISDDLNTCSQ